MDSRVPTPELQLEGKLMRQSTFDVHSPGDDVQYPMASALTSDDKAAVHLRNSFLVTEEDRSFLPSEHLGEVLSRQLIARELERYKLAGQLTSPITVDEISPPIGGTKTTYLIIFALLLLVDRGHEITQFVDHQLSDQRLPLVLVLGKRGYDLCLADYPTTPLRCFKDWKDHDKDYFDRWQYQLSVPFLTFQADKVRHHNFDDRTILPWCKRDSRTSGGRSGGYGAVKRVIIDKRCHGFRDILQKASGRP
jgi:hypothetical protein